MFLVFFTLAFYVFFGWLLMGSVHIIRNVLLSWIHVYLFRNIKDWSCLEVYVKELNSAENRTHRTCMSSKFSRFNTDVFAFLWYFLWIVDFLMRILEFESPHFVKYKNSYDFLKFAVMLKPLFQHRCGNWLQTSNFFSLCLSWIFSYYITCVCGTSPSGIMLKSSTNN